jgi:hypothetical protein
VSTARKPMVTEDQVLDLVKMLEEQKRKIAELEARLEQRESERMSRAKAAAAARIGRAASRAGMSVESWLRYCKRTGHDDPSRLDVRTKKRLGYRAP